MRYSRLSIVLATLACLGTVGCKTTESNNFKPFDSLLVTKEVDSVKVDRKAEKKAEKKKDKIEYGEPVRHGVIWVDSIYNEPGTRPVRGFGGRFYFYDEDGEAIRVEGELLVYAFDDSSTNDSNKVPDRKFVFRQDDLQTHYSETELGPSYSFWVPWDSVGGERKKISLLPIFVTASGRRINGDQSIGILPGRVPSDDSEMYSGVSKIMKENQIRQVGYDETVAGPLDDHLNRTYINKATISVPDVMAERMRRAQENSLGLRESASSATSQEVNAVRQQLQQQANFVQQQMGSIQQQAGDYRQQGPTLTDYQQQMPRRGPDPLSQFEPNGEWTTTVGTRQVPTNPNPTLQQMEMGTYPNGNFYPNQTMDSQNSGYGNPPSVPASELGFNRSGMGQPPQSNLRSTPPPMRNRGAY